jgi:hypothetical protein
MANAASGPEYVGDVGASPFTLSVGATLNQISYYMTNFYSTGRAQAALYANDGVNSVPTTLIVESSYVMAVTTLGQWYTQDVPPTYLPAGTYWLAILEGPTAGAGGNGPGLGYTSGGSFYDISLNSTPWAFPTTLTGGYKYSDTIGIYGTFCHS